MRIWSPSSKWFLSCVSLGIVALAAKYAGAEPRDPEARAFAARRKLV